MRCNSIHRLQKQIKEFASGTGAEYGMPAAIAGLFLSFDQEMIHEIQQG